MLYVDSVSIVQYCWLIAVSAYFRQPSPSSNHSPSLSPSVCAVGQWARSLTQHIRWRSCRCHASMTAFHAKVQCRCYIVDVASHLTASTPLSCVYCRIPWQSARRLYHNYCRIVNDASHTTASTSTDASIAAFHVKVQTVCVIIVPEYPSRSTRLLFVPDMLVYLWDPRTLVHCFFRPIFYQIYTDIGGVCQVVSVCFYLYFIPLSLLLVVPTLCIHFYCMMLSCLSKSLYDIIVK